MKLALLAILATVSLGFAVYWCLSLKKSGAEFKTLLPKPLQLLIGFVTNFFDTLGIGSFAPTTAAFRLFKMVPDQNIPGTLNVGHALPILAQALIFIAAIEVDMLTLTAMIAASIAGAWFGAGIVSKLPRRPIQFGMGAALFIAGTLFVFSNLGLFPGGGEDLALTGVKLWLGIGGNFILGALMTLGIGLYAPCMILVSLLGMSPAAAFPIMMGSCALLMPVGSVRFLRRKSYHPGAAVALTLGGIPAVLIAAYIVKSLDLQTVRWLVIVVVTYTALTLLRDALKNMAADKRADL